jgi:hypothetical protein
MRDSTSFGRKDRPVAGGFWAPSQLTTGGKPVVLSRCVIDDRQEMLTARSAPDSLRPGQTEGQKAPAVSRPAHCHATVNRVVYGSQ